MTARSMSSCRVKRVELAHVAFLLHRRARLIEHFEDQLSRQVVRQRLDQPTDFEWYTSAQRNSLQFDIHSAVALLESLHHNCAPDVSWPPGLYKRMLAGVAIVSDLLHAYNIAGDQCLVWGGLTIFTSSSVSAAAVTERPSAPQLRSTQPGPGLAQEPRFSG